MRTTQDADKEQQPTAVPKGRRKTKAICFVAVPSTLFVLIIDGKMNSGSDCVFVFVCRSVCVCVFV